VSSGARAGIVEIVRRLIALALLALALLIPLGASATAPSPSLRIVRTAPLAVRGSHFAAAELVTIRVIGKSTLARKRVRTGPLGGFTVAFPTLMFDPCTISAIVATGASGSRAQLKVRPAQCPPPPPS
jgi:hypothetical protein